MLGKLRYRKLAIQTISWLSTDDMNNETCAGILVSARDKGRSKRRPEVFSAGVRAPNHDNFTAYNDPDKFMSITSQ